MICLNSEVPTEQILLEVQYSKDHCEAFTFDLRVVLFVDVERARSECDRAVGSVVFTMADDSADSVARCVRSENNF
ncbi:hypothetical protein NL533_34760, partial [Klebsiella pneumoniae]|nr:hypothetical protein [Klebsiella pneumoniae]